MDTPTEPPHRLTSDTEPDAPAAETTANLSGTQTPSLSGMPTTALSGVQAPADPLAAPELRADEPAWGLAAAFGVWFASVGLLVAGSVLALLVYFVVRPASMSAGGLQQALASDPLLILLSVLGTLPVHLLTFAIAWAVVTGFGKRPFGEAIGWSWGARFGLWTSIGLAAGLWLFGILLATVFGGQETDIDRIIASSSAARFSIAFLAVATAPIVEETIYRGVLYAPLQRAAGTKLAVIIVAVMFAAVHFAQYWNNLGVVAAVTVLSFTLTWVRAHTGRLLPCFAIHAAFNGIQAIIIVAHPYLKTLTPTPPPTPPTAPPGMLLDALVQAFLRIQI